MLPATCIEDPLWLEEQVRLRGQIWGIDHRRVLAILWWYSASNRLVTPLLASLVTTGVGFSGRLDDLVLHHLPSSRLTGSHSTAVGGDDIRVLGDQLGRSFERTIAALTPFVGTRMRPLWAIAADAIADRLLWVGRASEQMETATALLAPLAEAIGPRLPRPRYVDIPVRPDRQLDITTGSAVYRAVDRISCCLIYRVPGEDRCAGCPGLPVKARHQLILARAE
jgi:ferric iron reductase protein FhuF